MDQIPISNHKCVLSLSFISNTKGPIVEDKNISVVIKTT